jgi:hypothetical protein
MIIDMLINKVLFILLFLSILNVVRNLFFLIASVRSGEKFIMNNRSLILLGLSISYILMTIFNGVTI